MSNHSYDEDDEDGCGSNSECKQNGERFICKHCATSYCENCVDSEMTKCASCSQRLCRLCPEKSTGEPIATEKCGFCKIEPLCFECHNTVDLHDDRVMKEYILCIKCSFECKKCKNMLCLNCCKNQKCCICKKDFNATKTKKSRKRPTSINATIAKIRKTQRRKPVTIGAFMTRQLKLRR